MDFNWLEALVIALSVYGALRGEMAYRRWQAKKNWKPQPSHTVSGIREIGRTQGAVDAIRCGHCGLMLKDFVEYDDGDKWCTACDAVEDD
ncbi:hypothetical protein LCGC14_1226620 [marine sediment metagenome]|uniref:Uncharacterized protein n=1 Tax=marine sediment metagenome TaxID=412755 RepID=A0A0F9LDS4_9ZZZZ